jgi:hypothetical protein
MLFMQNVVKQCRVLLIVMLNVAYVECRYAECHYVECRFLFIVTVKVA